MWGDLGTRTRSLLLCALGDVSVCVDQTRPAVLPISLEGLKRPAALPGFRMEQGDARGGTGVGLGGFLQLRAPWTAQRSCRLPCLRSVLREGVLPQKCVQASCASPGQPAWFSYRKTETEALSWIYP